MECSVEGCSNKAVVCEQHSSRIPREELKSLAAEVISEYMAERADLLAVARAAMNVFPEGTPEQLDALRNALKKAMQNPQLKADIARR